MGPPVDLQASVFDPHHPVFLAVGRDTVTHGIRSGTIHNLHMDGPEGPRGLVAPAPFHRKLALKPLIAPLFMQQFDPQFQGFRAHQSLTLAIKWDRALTVFATIFSLAQFVLPPRFNMNQPVTAPRFAFKISGHHAHCSPDKYERFDPPAQDVK